MCRSGKAILSVFFNVTDDEKSTLADPGTFFNWMDQKANSTNATVDLSQVLPKTAALNTTIAGYIGSDSTPPCDSDMCWYINEKVFKISSAQFEKLKVTGVAYNARASNMSPLSQYKTVLLNTGLFAKAPF